MGILYRNVFQFEKGWKSQRCRNMKFAGQPLVLIIACISIIEPFILLETKLQFCKKSIVVVVLFGSNNKFQNKNENVLICFIRETLTIWLSFISVGTVLSNCLLNCLSLHDQPGRAAVEVEMNTWNFDTQQLSLLRF